MSEFLCNDCIHCKKRFLRSPLCLLPIEEKVNIVTGKVKKKFISCKYKREQKLYFKNILMNSCGKEGSKFKSKFGTKEEWAESIKVIRG